MISEQKKEALAAKERGIELGGNRGTLPAVSAEGRAVSLKARQAKAARHSDDLADIITSIQAEGVTSLYGIAKALTERGVPTARGHATWAPTQVARLLGRAG